MQEIYKILNRIKGRFDITTDTELAELLGVKQNTISSWRSRGNIPYKKIIAFCVKHDIDQDYFFGDQETVKTSSLNSEMSELVQILSSLKDEDTSRFNVVKSLLIDYKKVVDYLHGNDLQEDHTCHEEKPSLSVVVAEPKCFICKEKLINFEFDIEGSLAILICKNCNTRDEKQITHFKAELQKKMG